MIIFVDENDENKRLDSFLSEITPDLSRSKIQSLIKNGGVKLNDEAKKPSYQLKENDKIEFELPQGTENSIQQEVHGNGKKGLLS